MVELIVSKLKQLGAEKMTILFRYLGKRRHGLKPRLCDTTAGFVSVVQGTTHQDFHLYMMNDTVTMREVTDTNTYID